ncbi:hypothetical protein HPB52_012201 [Rhipicephalus sanguineus]|uniref:Uncharacterized protein n=1 Tax=Rhipicephalus sanguineus TaxID=34632 RepID=A0A9D4SY96_RHISA|nr:hypothetical protein HPB52_012201 [Rhipicephalus sanguineus]
MTVDVDKLLCDSVAKLEAFTRQRRELDLHRYLLIDIMMRKIEMATLEGRNTVAQELGNPQNDGGEPQRPCSFNAGRDPQGGRAEHSQVLMAEMASERDSMQVSDARALGENAPSVTRSEAADTFHGALGVTDRDSLQGDDIVLDGDSMAANSSTDSASLTADEGIHSDLDDVVNAFGDSLADGGPEPGANTSSNDVPGNIDLVSQNSAEALESLQYKDMTTFKGSSNSERDLSASGPSASSESIGINFEVVEEAEPQLAQGGDADVSSDASKAEDAPASDLFDLTVLKNVIVNVSELPIPSNLLELPDQEPK